MYWSKFNTQVSGKWVLAGEHSVLKGVSAVALPHRGFELSLTYQPALGADSSLKGPEGGATSEPSGVGEFLVDPSESQALILEILKSVADIVKAGGTSFQFPKGSLKIESTIPIGAGLGSSAALCVALTRWLAGPLSLPKGDLVSFATQLEHRFHGTSSGMDVAVITAGEAVSFVQGRGVVLLGIKQMPDFTFHNTGLRSKTRDCVGKVQRFRVANPSLGVQVDEWMAEASTLASEGLRLFDSGKFVEGLQLLKDSMRKSQKCFYSWDLVPAKASEMEKQLLAQGALAVKVTGAGDGGMLVALWPLKK